MTADQHQQQTEQQLQATDELREYEYNKQVVSWCDILPKRVSNDLFQYLPFVTKEHETFGSEWQQLVCAKVGVPPECQKRFWGERGMNLARRAVNRRRNTTTTAMKNKFIGKWRSGVCLMT